MIGQQLVSSHLEHYSMASMTNDILFLHNINKTLNRMEYVQCAKAFQIDKSCCCHWVAQAMRNLLRLNDLNAHIDCHTMSRWISSTECIANSREHDDSSKCEIGFADNIFGHATCISMTQFASGEISEAFPRNYRFVVGALPHMKGCLPKHHLLPMINSNALRIDAVTMNNNIRIKLRQSYQT